MIAVEKGFRSVIEKMVLTNEPAFVDVVDAQGRCALNYANDEMIKQFLLKELVLSKVLFVSGEKLSDIRQFQTGNFGVAYLAKMTLEIGTASYELMLL
eukprot:TRINITY_DN950_c0_g1_i2.p1 TRINITY_DN950_c0_g1~~TRINITY_DN950_c0_g1_i2.p1  ORF type:complete len:98 (-),score=16.95 TRINITY_DN950_c0_g1_i2:1059-1352(-)